MAMIAHRLGYRVILIERGRHPRFAIGESASPLAGILIEQLADRYDLPRVRPLSAFGTWQRTYPDVVCGLKRGFSYFRHEVRTPFKAFVIVRPMTALGAAWGPISRIASPVQPEAPPQMSVTRPLNTVCAM